MKQAGQVARFWAAAEARGERRTWEQSLQELTPNRWTAAVERMLSRMVLSPVAVMREASEGTYHSEPTWPSAEHVASMEEIRFVLSFLAAAERGDP